MRPVGPDCDPGFPKALREALFARLLTHDVVDLDAALPAAIRLDYADDQLERCFRLSRQMWRDGVDRPGLARLVVRLGFGRPDPAPRRAFKHVRARFKHLRCCLAAFDARHRYSPAFNLLIVKMGRLQDALGSRQPGARRAQAAIVRLLLTPLPWQAVRRQVEDYRPCTAESFRAYVAAETAALARGLAEPALTAETFHDLRKIVSRWVAVYDVLDVLYPTPDHARIARYVGSVNGMMGALHDRMVERRLAGTQDYDRDTFPLPPEVRERLEPLAVRMAAAL